MRFLQSLALAVLVSFPASADFTPGGEGSPADFPNGATTTTVTASGLITANGGVTTTGSTTLDDVTVTGFLNLPTSGGTPADLNHYEEFTHATTFTWNAGGTTGASANLKITRIGKVVTILFPSNATATTGTSSTQFSADTVLPARFRPATSPVGGLITFANNGLVSDALISIDSAGNILVRRPGSAAFANDSTAGSGFNDTINNGIMYVYTIQ